MSRKSFFYIGATIGSLIGGYIPSLWGAGAFSGWSLFLGTIGGIAGVWLAYRATA